MYKFQVQHDQSALLSIDGKPIVRGTCCSSPYGSHGFVQPHPGQPYQISVGYIQRTGSTFYALAKWKFCESDKCENGEYSFIQGSATHGVSISTYSDPRGGACILTAPQLQTSQASS